MKTFRVVFNFGKDNDVTYFCEGESRANVLEEMTVGNEESYVDFVRDDVHYRIDMRKVNYVAVSEYKS